MEKEKVQNNTTVEEPKSAENKPIKVRPLKTKDVMTVARMLLKVVGEAKDKLSNIIKASNLSPEEAEKETESQKKVRKMELGLNLALTVLDTCLIYAESDLKAWFADLIGIAPEEFDETPLNTIPEIMSQLKTNEDLKSFFSNVLVLFSEMNASAGNLLKKST